MNWPHRHHHRHDPSSRSALVLMTAPAVAAVSLDEFKAQLRGTPAEDDSFLQAILDTAIDQIDPSGGGWLGRALRPQQWELRLDRFPPCEFRLPYPPLITVDSVSYVDLAGATQTLAANIGYRLFTAGALGLAFLRPPYGGCWPCARWDAEAVKVKFTAGYAATPTDTLPAPIKQACLLMAKALYDLGARNAFISTDTVIGVSSKSFAVTDAAVQTMRNAAENLLSTYRVF